MFVNYSFHTTVRLLIVNKYDTFSHVGCHCNIQFPSMLCYLDRGVAYLRQKNLNSLLSFSNKHTHTMQEVRNLTTTYKNTISCCRMTETSLRKRALYEYDTGCNLIGSLTDCAVVSGVLRWINLPPVSGPWRTISHPKHARNNTHSHKGTFCMPFIMGIQDWNQWRTKERIVPILCSSVRCEDNHWFLNGLDNLMMLQVVALLKKA